MNKYIDAVKKYFSIGKDWVKANGDWKTIGIAGIIGLLTFSSWASLFLGILTCGVHYLLKTKVSDSIKNLINIDFDKYILNAALGFVIASLFILIF